MPPFPRDNACHVIDNKVQSNQDEEKLSVDDFQGSEEKLRAQLMSDQNTRNEHPGWCPAWMLTTYDESTTKVNTIDDELKRLKTLERFRILDEDVHDDTIDGLTSMAATMFGVSVACVDLVDLGRLRIFANHGLGKDVKFAPRNDSFCSHAIQCVEQVCVVRNAAEDDRFRNHWLVTGQSNVRFYAAAALVVGDYKIGTFCILDSQPRPHGLSAEQKQLLVQLAATTTRILVDRRDSLEIQERMECSMASFSHGIMTPLNGLTLALTAIRELDQASLEEQSCLAKCDSTPSRGLLTTEQRELLSTASCCVDALVKMHRRNQDSMRGLLAPITKDSVVTQTRNLSEIVSCLMETLAPIPKKVPVFMEIDSAVPETTIFSRTQDLTVFRVAMSCLSTACARTLRGFILLRIFRHYSQGADDRIVFECHDCGPHPSDHDAAEFQLRLGDKPTCSQAIQRDQPIIHDSSLQGLLFALQSVEPIHGCYGYRKRVTGGDSPQNDHCYDPSKEGSVFWFSFPFPHSLQQSSVAPLVCPPVSKSKAGEREGPFKPVMQPAVAAIEMSTRTADITDGGKKRSNALSSPLEGSSCCSANDQASSSTNMAKLVSPKLLQPPNDAGMSKCQEVSPQKDNCCSLSRKKQALIIDDALIIRKTLARVLNQMGYEVSLAVDGQDGCEKLKESLYDLVLCDFLMPIMDGADCVRQYRSWEFQNRPGFHQFVMGMSGHASSLDAEQAIESGMDGFYAKPVTRKILDSMLQTEAAREVASMLDRYWTASGYFPAITWSGKDEQDTYVANAVSRCALTENNPFNDVDCSLSSAISMDVTGVNAQCAVAETDPKMKFRIVRHCLMATKFEISDFFLRGMQCHGWQVCFANNCLDAMDLLKGRNWDAVVIGDTFYSSSTSSPFCPDDSNWCAAQYVAEFRDWETSNRFNRQRNLFLHCSYSAPELDQDATGGSSKASVLIQPPPGFDGALNIDMQWEDFNRLVSQQNSADQDNRYDLFFVKRRRNGSVLYTN